MEAVIFKLSLSLSYFLIFSSSKKIILGSYEKKGRELSSLIIFLFKIMSKLWRNNLITLVMNNIILICFHCFKQILHYLI